MVLTVIVNILLDIIYPGDLIQFSVHLHTYKLIHNLHL